MKKRRRREWFDDDSLWRAFYPFLFPESQFAGAVGDVKNLLTLARPRGKAVLDLCCGPGRYSIPLARRGYAVTGVDRTKYFLDKARARARAAGVKIEWVREDMRDFIRQDAFDLVLNMETSFGYFDDKREDLEVLHSIVTSLRSGGVCLIQVGGKEWLARVFTPTTSRKLPDGSTLVQRHTIFDDWTRIRNEWIFIRRGRVKTITMHHTVYSAQELRERMEQAGFVDVRIFGNLDGGEYGPSAQWLIALGRKPGAASPAQRSRAGTFKPHRG